MNIDILHNLIKEIVKKSVDLKNKYTNYSDAKVNYACIFCKSNEEFNDYINILKQNNNYIIEDTYSGPLFRLNDLETVAGTLKLLKVRKFDDKHLELGDADFTINNYEEFKNKYLNNSNFKLICTDTYEMIELKEENCDVRVYFSNPPPDKELGIN